MYDNPYRIHGVTVEEPECFSGRAKLVRVIRQFAKKKYANNLAIIGELSIGKKSLIHQAFHGEIQNEQKETENFMEYLEKKGIFMVKINVSTIPKNDPAEFFIYMMINSLRLFEDNHYLSREVLQRLNVLYEHAKERRNNWGDFIAYVKRFLIFLKKHITNFIFVLTKFDAVRELFKNKINLYQSFRELMDDPKPRMSYIIVSRRQISVIEEQCGSISDLAALFPRTYYVRPFTTDEINLHLLPLEKMGIKLTDVHKKCIIYYCGGYPYLLNILCDRIIDEYELSEEIGNDIVDEAFIEAEISFLRLYQKLVALLQEEDRLEMVQELLFKPRPKVPQIDINELLRYSLIYEEASSYRAFSKHFEHYLSEL